MIKAILFDMDGVLIDSPKYIIKAHDEILKKYGVIRTKEQQAVSLGHSIRDLIGIWEKEFNLPKLDFETVSKKSFDLQIITIKKEVHPDPVVISLIKNAKKNGIKIAVTTSSTKERAKTFLDLVGVSKYLDAFITANDVNEHKPSPVPFLKTAELLGVDPNDCVVFEDATNGIDAANSAKMISIALITDFNSKEEFIGKADFIITNFSEVTPDFLSKLTKK